MTRADLEEKIALKEIERNAALVSDTDLSTCQRRYVALSVELWGLQALYAEKFPTKESAQAKPLLAAEADVRAWLLDHKNRHDPTLPYPGEEADRRAAEAALGRVVPRGRFRKLRQDIIPADWRREGRRRTATASPPGRPRGRYSTK
jgi:hypothetical protein